MDMTKILVTGATGQIGSAVVEALVKNGTKVKAASRKIAGIAPSENIEPVVFDYENPADHVAVLSGISGIYLVAPPLDLDAPARLIPFIDKAIASGVGHIVFNSVLAADSNEQHPLRIIEKHLMRSGSGYTILRPNFFMENFSTGWASPMIAAGEIRVPAGPSQTSFISVKDIASAAVSAFSKKLYGTEYNLTGSEALDYGQAAAIISYVSGRTVTYQAITEDAMRRMVMEHGMPQSAVQYIAMLFSAVRDDRMSVVTSDILELTGESPITFDEFAARNAKYWKFEKAA
jgi:uncharacterized protein YbjT (DUF2867 family)